MNEEIDQHLPSGIAEEFGGTEELLAEQSPPHQRFRVGEGEIVVANRVLSLRALQRKRRSCRGAGRCILMDDVMRKGRGHDDMIDNFDTESPADLVELAGDLNVFKARGRVPAWVIVDKDDGCGIQFARAPEDGPGVEADLRDRTALHFLIGDEAVRGVEEQDAEALIVETSHRQDEILPEFGAERPDRNSPNVRARRRDCRATRAKNDLHRRGARIDDPRYRFGLLRP